MDSLQQIKARLVSLTELHDLIRALRALSAAQVRNAQSALPGATRYVRIIEDAIADAALLAKLPPVGSRRAIGGAEIAAGDIMLVICTEQGFVGGLNARLIESAAAALRDSDSLVVVGRQGQLKATERNIAPALGFSMTTHIAGVQDLAGRICRSLGDVARFRLHFAVARPSGVTEVVTREILPFPTEVVDRSVQRQSPLHHLAADDLLARLASEYVFAEVSRALIESLASESAARLRAMQAADEKIGDKVEKLVSEERIMRQQEITEELLDVVTGATAALNGRAGLN